MSNEVFSVLFIASYVVVIAWVCYWYLWRSVHCPECKLGRVRVLTPEELMEVIRANPGLSLREVILKCKRCDKTFRRTNGLS